MANDRPKHPGPEAAPGLDGAVKNLGTSAGDQRQPHGNQSENRGGQDPAVSKYFDCHSILNLPRWWRRDWWNDLNPATHWNKDTGSAGRLFHDGARPGINGGGADEGVQDDLK